MSDLFTNAGTQNFLNNQNNQMAQWNQQSNDALNGGLFAYNHNTPYGPGGFGTPYYQNLTNSLSPTFGPAADPGTYSPGNQRNLSSFSGTPLSPGGGGGGGGASVFDTGTTAFNPYGNLSFGAGQQNTFGGGLSAAVPNVFTSGSAPYNDYGNPALGAGPQQNTFGPPPTPVSGPSQNIFNPYEYLFQNPDIAQRNENPWEHWNTYGRNEGRALTSDTFDGAAYLRANPDVAGRGEDPWEQYLKFGINEGRTGGFKEMDNYTKLAKAAYLRDNPDIAQRGEDPFWHYNTFGKNEGRAAPTPEFDYSGYLAANPDIAERGEDPFEQWMTYGANEGRGGWDFGGQKRNPFQTGTEGFDDFGLGTGGTGSGSMSPTGNYDQFQSSARDPLTNLLAGQRQSYATLARNDPNLMFKLVAKAMEEDQNSSEGRTAVVEAMLNRLNATGQNPLNPKYYPTDKEAYNAEIEQRLRNNPALYAQVLKDVERAFGGSNLAKFGTNWSSGKTWEREQPLVNPTLALGANNFYIKNLGTPAGVAFAGPGITAQNNKWFNNVSRASPNIFPTP
jgi:hypothetical protein